MNSNSENSQHQNAEVNVLDLKNIYRNAKTTVILKRKSKYLFPGDPVDLMHGTYVATEKMMPHLLTSLAAQGWITEHFLLCADEWRADWDFSGLPDKKQY